MQMVDNMGSLLQSYALKKTLESMSAQVEFINIVPNDEDNRLLEGYKQQYLEEKEKIGFVGKIKKFDKYVVNRLRIKRKSNQQNAVFNDFRVKQLKIEKKSLKYDVCVIGSDEVFNCLNTNGWGFTSQLFGNVPEARKVITYAASCGSTKYAELPTKVADRIRKSFEHVSAFSIRDQNTHDFVTSLTDAAIEDNFDPVLIYDFGKELEEVSLPELPEHYCVVYSYYNRIHNEDEINTIMQFCRKHHLTPVALGAPQFWIKDYIICSPFQCLKIFESADFVFTDTFHGTIFASKYTKKFAVLVRESNRNKLSDLVEKIGMQDHLIGTIIEVDKKYYITKNLKRFHSIIETEKNKSWQYLKTNIGD